MCGLAGFWLSCKERFDGEAVLREMGRRLRHRGPDADYQVFDPRTGVGMVHQRLSIIDLSEAGKQPMVSRSGRTRLVFNGEIYNYESLRAHPALRDVDLTGGDTRVLVELLERLPIETVLPLLRGMFAIAVFFEDRREMVVARDRLGIKPFYIWDRGSGLGFASEPKALLALPGEMPCLDSEALASYFRYGFIPAPLSAFSGVVKLEPGCWRRYKEQDGCPTLVEEQRYWDVAKVAQSGAADPLTEEEGYPLLAEALREAVRYRLIADVEVGCFLSGGIDSSTIAALAAEVSTTPIKTFTIGFRDEAYNEAAFAADIATHLGTEHHEQAFGEKELLDLVPNLTHFYCEPFADSSQLPTMLVSQFAARHVKVALSGDGGDELDAGYHRHINAGRVAAMRNRLPGVVRRGTASLIRIFSVETLDRVHGLASPVLPRSARVKLPGEKLHKLAKALKAKDASDLYSQIAGIEVLPDLVSDTARQDPSLRRVDSFSIAESFVLFDYQRYMVDDILHKVDRASMAMGLEARVPFIDHKVVELGFRMPFATKTDGREGKKHLRKLLGERVPISLWDRPKQGFAIPIARWLRGPLRAWAEDLMTDLDKGLVPWLDTAQARLLWRSFLDDRLNAGAQTWALLVFLDWRRRYRVVR